MSTFGFIRFDGEKYAGDRSQPNFDICGPLQTGKSQI
jgi:hypothetical protein